MVLGTIKPWVRSEDVIKGNGPIMIRLPHNHLPPNVDIPMVHLRRSIGLAGTSTGNLTNSIRQIYNQEVVLNPESAHNYTHLQSRLCLHKMRNRRRPVNPKTVDQLAHILNEAKAMPYVSTLQNPSSSPKYCWSNYSKSKIIFQNCKLQRAQITQTRTK